MNVHVLDTNLILRRAVNVAVVGCGGTGTATAGGLPYMHQAMRARGLEGLQVCFIDGDTISPTNCVRQPFSRGEVGLYKAVVLANRLNVFWKLNWTAWPGYLDRAIAKEWKADIVIGCVDRRSARKTIADVIAGTSRVAYWLDLGNNADNGQFVLGQPVNARQRFNMAGRLPTVAELYPEILDPVAEADDDLPSCSAIEALERQQPFVNQVLAAQALALLSRLFWEGEIHYHGGFVNLATGRCSALPIDPKQWKRLKRWERKTA